MITIRPSTVICLHASASSSAQWNALAQRLRSRYRVLAPDLHGHGVGPALQDDDTSALAQDVALVTQLLDGVPGGAHLVGHSYGGAVALRTAMRRRDKVRSVAVYEPVVFRVLLEYNCSHPAAREIIHVATAVDSRVRTGRLHDAAAGFIDYWSGGDTWSRLPPARRDALALRMPIVATHFRALFDEPMGFSDLINIEAPVLHLTGSDTRASTYRLAELLRYTMPRARFRELADHAHMSPLTQPDTVNGELEAFLDAQPRAQALRVAA